MQRFFPAGSALLSLILLFLVTASPVQAKCGAQKPETAPRLISAVAKDQAVELTWEESTGPLTHYVLSYGTSPTSYDYGNPNIGPKGTTSFVVDHLANGQKYYFKIMAVNTCKTSEVSDKISAVPGVSTVIPQKQPGRPPVLSIYKTVDTATAAATTGKTSTTNTHKQGAVATASLASCTATCDSWKVLGAEIVMLIAFFTIAHLFKGTKLSASLLIPLITSLFYLKTSGDCTSSAFLCKYFYPLTFMLYASSVIFYKHYFTHKKRGVSSKKKKQRIAFVAI